MGRATVLCALVILVFTTASQARTWYIAPDGTGDAPTIPDAADSAAYGDTILVAPGTYICPDNTDYSFYWVVLTSGVSLLSSEGADATIILDNTSYFYPHAVVDIAEASDCLVRGFTFRREQRTAWYHGIVTWKTTGCAIESCTFEGFHNAIEISGKTQPTVSPLVSRCYFTRCTVGVECANIYPENTPVIQANDFHDCVWGVYCFSAAPVITRNRFTECFWAGIYCADRSPAVITRNSIADNVKYGLYVMTPAGYEPSLFDGSVPASGNSFFGNGECDLLFETPTGGGRLYALFTYWGSDCPDFSGVICGTGVDYIPWTNSTHTEIFSQCPPQATEPTTWGAIKSIYK